MNSGPGPGAEIGAVSNLRSRLYDVIQMVSHAWARERVDAALRPRRLEGEETQ
jgi:hypothetical protein